MSDQAAWLTALLCRRHEDGSLKFTRREVEDLVAAVVLAQGFEAGTLPPIVAGAVTGLAERAALDPREDPETRQQRIEAYLEANPLPKELLVDLKQSLHAEAAEGDDTDADAVLAFLDRKPPRLEGRRGERPAGTRPGGALGFFLARDDLADD